MKKIIALALLFNCINVFAYDVGSALKMIGDGKKVLDESSRETKKQDNVSSPTKQSKEENNNETLSSLRKEVYLHNSKVISNKSEKNNTLNPYGEGVIWTNSISQVFDKICKMDSISMIGVSSRTYQDARDIIGMNKFDAGVKFYNKNDICNSENFNILEDAFNLTDLMRPKKDSIDERLRKDALKDFRSSISLREVNGRQYLMESFPISIYAQGITIADIPFILSYEFSISKDVTAGELSSEENSYCFVLDNKKIFSYPFLTQAVLFADRSKQLNDYSIKFKKIGETIKEKYISILDKQNTLVDNNRFDIRDKNGVTIVSQYNTFIIKYMIDNASHPMVLKNKNKYNQLINNSLKIKDNGL